MELALTHLLLVNPPPPGSPEQWIWNNEKTLNGPLFRHWSDDARAQFLTNARLALTALLRPPCHEDPQLGPPRCAVTTGGSG